MAGTLILTVQVLGVVALMLVVASLVVVGPRRLRATYADIRPRLRATGPSVALLVLVLLINSFIRDVSDDISWLVGINITGTIHAVEGAFVSNVQALASPPLTAYFSFVYVYGYAFVLIFPLVAYLALEDQRPLRELTMAYIINYVVGLICYLIFIAYGPRNLIPDLVDSLLYTNWPQAQLLTSEVNRNTNVFPSLHTSMSVAVAIFAYRTRDVYPRWFPVAILGAASVSISTMYLGIHWGIDVVAGLVLAVLSVTGAEHARRFLDERDIKPGQRLWTRLARRFE